ncbi:MAG: hypothetical protein JWQ27_85 [Ferruginibacter sp.]|nr:hypothetical protein [Ferruginibacter sp.]
MRIEPDTVREIYIPQVVFQNTCGSNAMWLKRKWLKPVTDWRLQKAAVIFQNTGARGDTKFAILRIGD